MIFVMALVVAMFAAAILDVYGVVVSVPVFASAVGVVWYGITQRQSGARVPPRSATWGTSLGAGGGAGGGGGSDGGEGADSGGGCGGAAVVVEAVVGAAGAVAVVVGERGAARRDSGGRG